MYGGDFGALEAMLHDELLYTRSSGLTDTHQQRSAREQYRYVGIGQRRPLVIKESSRVMWL